jgi:iron complex outermembrane receptor protein
MSRASYLAGAALLLAGMSTAAQAQRTQDNAATKAEDAFGTSIGGEQIGIYSANYVRGFSAAEAGNIRLDGLYFDQQANFTDRLVGGLQMRVGLSAQSYPFPAPTGIADFQLRRPGDKRVVSASARLGPFGTLAADLDAQLPIAKGLSIGLGAGAIAEKTHFGGDPRYLAAAVSARWQPSDKIEIMPFFGRLKVSSEESQPLFFTPGNVLPPRIPRRRLLTQDWAENKGDLTNAGVLGSARFGGWTLRGGLFRSVFDLERSFTTLFSDTQPTGQATEVIIADPHRRFASTSGEVRLSRSIAEGDRLHTVHAMVRGRSRDRLYGGSDTRVLGTHDIAQPLAVAEPSFSFGPRTRDQVRQVTAGLAYEGRWRGVGELSFGIQKTRYRKSIIAPAGPLPESRDNPWLFNGTIAATLTPSVALFAGFSRGLEESPVAPDIAINKDEAPPAIRTRQVDAGVRWAIRPNLRLIAGVFEVEKPYFNLDEARLFKEQGSIRHRGAEFSLSGQIAPGWTAVLGTMLLDAQLSGPLVEAGVLGRRPVSSFGRLSNAIIEYRPPSFSRFSADLLVESTSDRVASVDGRTVIPARTILSLGSRYRFKIGKAPATFRAQVSNVFDNYGLANGPSGLYVFNLPRRLTLSLTSDF